MRCSTFGRRQGSVVSREEDRVHRSYGGRHCKVQPTTECRKHVTLYPHQSHVQVKCGSVAVSQTRSFDLSIAVYAYIVKNHNLVAHRRDATLVGGALAVVVVGLGLVLGLVGAMLHSADGTIDLVADGVAVLGLLLVGL